MVQCRPVSACGSSTAGRVSFHEEAEFNEVMMVPSSEQLKWETCNAHDTTGVDHSNLVHDKSTRVLALPHVGNIRRSKESCAILIPIVFLVKFDYRLN